MDAEIKTKGEKKDWRQVRDSQRFLNAYRGLGVFCKTTRHLYMHITISLVTIILGFYFKLSSYEWTSIVFAIGLVFVAEMFNTAIEIDIDLTSPEYHPYAKDTKDVAAGAVLFSTFIALIIAVIVFLPKIIL
jgi:undecaprenol kinase/diacylglycerol kinase (ATP)